MARHVLFLVLTCYISLFSVTDSLHLTGVWHTREFFRFLAKFGFQQTNMHELEETEGYIYGNVTSPDNVSHSMALVVVDAEYFLYYFGNRSVLPRVQACPAMFSKIDTIAWDEQCNGKGLQDFIRHIPCPRNALCQDETDPNSVLPGYQFTYRVRDINQPRFWYISLVSCYRNSSCVWTYEVDKSDTVLTYDIWLVNGRPDQKLNNPLEHQFSFEVHGIVQLYAVFAIAYTLLLPVQLYALSVQRHALPLLLTICLALEYLGVVLNTIHVSKFAVDGSGFTTFHVAGNFIDTASQCMFMLLLLLIVKGWTITRQKLEWPSKLILFAVWAAYTAASVALFLWNLSEVDLISDIDEWQTWPGWLILTFRVVIMLWFLWELRETFNVERNNVKAKFYLNFGAGFLVWFVYLPLVTLVCSQVSSLWRHKTILSVCYSADFLSLCVLIHLLWPSRSHLYFNLDQPDTRMHVEGLDFAGMSLFQELSDSSDVPDDVYDVSSDHETLVSTHPGHSATQPNTSSNRPTIFSGSRNGFVLHS